MAPDVDDRFERYYGYLNDDVTRRRHQRRAGARARAGCTRRAPPAAGASSPAAASSAAGCSRSTTPTGRSSPVPCGCPTGSPPTSSAATSPTPRWRSCSSTSRRRPSRRREPLVRALAGRDAFVYLHDRESTAMHTAVDAAAAAGVPLVVVDLVRVAASPTPTRILAAAVREARLRGGVLVAGPVDELAEADVDGRAAPDRVAGAAGADRPPRLGAALGRPPAVHRRGAAAQPREARARIWDEALRGDDDGARLRRRRRHGAVPPRRRRRSARRPAAAATIARPRGSADRRPPTSGAAPGSRTRPGSSASPAASSRPSSWDDLVLPPATSAGLRGLADRARHREQVLGDVADASGRRPRHRDHGAVRRRLRDRQDDERRGHRRRPRPRPVRRQPGDGRRQVHRRDGEEPRPHLRRGRRRQRRAAVRRGRRPVRAALRGPRQPRSLRQHRGRLPAAADGDVRRAGRSCPPTCARTSTRPSPGAST